MCAEFALEHAEALFFEEGVEWCGVVFGWVGAPWYEFAGGSWVVVRGGGVGREVPGEVVGDVSWVEDRFVASGVVEVGLRDGCVDVWIVEVVVWGVVVVRWGAVPAPRPSRELGDVDFWTLLVCDINRASVRSQRQRRRSSSTTWIPRSR